MWEKEIALITQKQSEFGEAVSGGISEEKIEILDSKIRELYEISLPEEYKTFLNEMDGFEFDGYCIFGSGSVDDGLSLIDENEIMHSYNVEKNLLLLGKSDMDWYVMKDKSFFVMDESEDIYESFESCHQLISYIIDTALGR